MIILKIAPRGGTWKPKNRRPDVHGASRAELAREYRDQRLLPQAKGPVMAFCGCTFFGFFGVSGFQLFGIKKIPL